MFSEQDKQALFDTIRDIHDYPKPGIIFKDITTLLNNPEQFSKLQSLLVRCYPMMSATSVWSQVVAQPLSLGLSNRIKLITVLVVGLDFMILRTSVRYAFTFCLACLYPSGYVRLTNDDQSGQNTS